MLHTMLMLVIQPFLATTMHHFVGNLAYHKSTKQSSTFNGGDPSRATDGIKIANFVNNSCSLTRREVLPWWRVDLGARHRIGNIRITNRGDCCASRLKRIDVRVNDADNLDGELYVASLLFILFLFHLANDIRSQGFYFGIYLLKLHLDIVCIKCIIGQNEHISNSLFCSS